jgi:DNA-binding MarR family transcriptional regulator
MEQTVGALIDRLIKDGYIKTKGHGSDAELLKHWEE